MGKIRVTVRNAKSGKDGVFQAKHNDRCYDYSKDKHIDSERVKDNMYFICQEKYKGLNFYELEKQFYEDNFSDIVEKRNKNYINQGHKEKCKTVDEYRESRRHAPTETLYYIGDREAQNENILLRNRNFHLKIMIEQYKWEREKFPQIRWLNLAYHGDEIDENSVLSAGHYHGRKCFMYRTDDGCYDVDASKCLEQMGIKRPNPDEKRSRYNNELMTYTAMCREHFQDLCESYGLDIEREPREASESGLKREEYVLRQKRKEADKVVSDAQKEADSIMSEAKVTASKIKKDAHRQGEQYKQAASKVYQSVCEKEYALQQSITAIKQIREDLYEKTSHFAEYGEDIIQEAEDLLYSL